MKLSILSLYDCFETRKWGKYGILQNVTSHAVCEKPAWLVKYKEKPQTKMTEVRPTICIVRKA